MESALPSAFGFTAYAVMRCRVTGRVEIGREHPTILCAQLDVAPCNMWHAEITLPSGNLSLRPLLAGSISQGLCHEHMPLHGWACVIEPVRRQRTQEP